MTGPAALATLIRDHDWSASPLGPAAHWSAVLRTSVDNVLASAFPAFVAWGEEQILVYNDGYAAILADRHPAALGRRYADVWAELGDVLAPLGARALVHGATFRMDDMPVRMRRHGIEEDAWFTFSYGPVRADGRIRGLLCHCLETTDAVRARQQRDAGADALRASEAQARVNAERVQLALAAGAIIGTWFWDLPTDRFTVDEAFARAFGLDPALGRSGLSLAQVVDTVHPDDKPGLAQAIADVRARGGAYAHQYRVRRSDGRYYWIEANGRVDLGPDGTGGTFPGVLIDVEGRRAVEAERDHAIAKLRALNAELEQKVMAQALARGRNWQISPDVLGVLNAEGYFEASNPAWTTTLGWSEDEVASTHFLDLIHPGERECTRLAWNDALRGDAPTLRLASRWRHKDGGWRWLSWVAVPDGAKVYWSARDVTDEKAAEAELVARTAERDRMWNSSPDLMLVIDFAGIFQRVNPAWTRLLGYEPAELVGHHIHEFVAADDHAPMAPGFAASARGEQTRIVNRYRHKDGSLRTISWIGAPAGDVTYATGRDITAERARQAELERAQDQLRQSQKMEAVGQLTGGLAHDFNNLLAGISGSLELMNLRIRQGKPADAGKYMATAMGATRRAAALTHRLLAFSRRQTLAPVATDVGRLAAGLLDMIRRTVGPSVQVDVVPDAGLWPVLADQSQLENALLNLCINARDAMPDGGPIVIRGANRRIDAQAALAWDMQPGEYLALSVADTGTGMAPDVIAKAFEPFFTTKPIGQGTGLGLSMIYGFAKQSGGQVRIDSEVGRGTTVCLYLPRHHGVPAHAEAAPAAARVAPDGAGETVLVVDDEPSVRMLVADVLADLGYKTLEAADGAAGLEILQSAVRIDLLISDVGLPGLMNGRQMADASRVRRPGLNVLFITGYAETALLSDGQLEPGMAILTKPFTVETLAARVRAMIARPALPAAGGAVE